MQGTVKKDLHLKLHSLITQRSQKMNQTKIPIFHQKNWKN